MAICVTRIARSFASSAKVTKVANESSGSEASTSNNKIGTRTLLYGTQIMTSESKGVLAQYPKLLNKQNFAKTSILNPRQLKLSPHDSLKNATSFYKLPSVSAILGCTRSTDSTERLFKWQQKMVKDKGLDGFKRFMKERVDIGKQMHVTIAQYITSKNRKEVDEVAEGLPEAVRGYWKSIAPMLKYVGFCELSEKALTHQRLCYQGICDAVATYEGQIVLFDWKTASSGSVKKRSRALKDLYDDPVQLAAYVGAFNADANFSQKAQRAAIVVAHEDGSAGAWHDMHESELEEYWNQWLERLHSFWKFMGSLPEGETANFVHKSPYR